MTYVLFHSRFQLSKKRKRAGDDGKKEKVGGGGGRQRPRFLSFSFPSSPMRSFFFFLLPILSPSHIKGISIFTTREAKHCER